MGGDPQQGGATARTPTPIDAPVGAVERGDTMTTYDLLDTARAPAKGNA